MTENSRDGDNDDSKDDYDVYGGGFDDNDDKNDQKHTHFMIFQTKKKGKKCGKENGRQLNKGHPSYLAKDLD